MVALQRAWISLLAAETLIQRGQRGQSLQDFHQQYDNWGRTAHRVTLLHTDTNADTATVTVEIAVFSAGAFGASDQSSVQTFTLLRFNGVWRITGPAYIYP